MKLIHKWNKVIIKKYPALWMSLLHLILPGSLILLGIGFALGWSDPSLKMETLFIYEAIISFILCLVIMILQSFRLIKQIKFKTLLHFYLLCIIGYFAVFVSVFSPTIAVHYKLSYKLGEEKVNNDLHNYQKNVFIYALQKDPILDSVIVLKKDKLSIESNSPSPIISHIYDYIIEDESSLIFENDAIQNNLKEVFQEMMPTNDKIYNRVISTYLNNHYTIDYFNYSDHTNLVDSVLSIGSITDISHIISEIEETAGVYGFPSVSVYPSSIIEWNQDSYDYKNDYVTFRSFWTGGYGDFYEISNIHSNLNGENFISFLYIHLVVCCFFSLIAGIILSSPIRREAVWSSIISVLFIAFFSFIPEFISSKLYFNRVLVSVIGIGIVLFISIYSIFWFLTKRIKHMTIKKYFFVHQANFQLISLLILVHLFFDSLGQYAFKTYFFIFPLFLLIINFIYLKIYHKLYNLPKS